MRTIVVPVHYDFASSICYVAHRVMERVGLDDLASNCAGSRSISAS